MKVKYKYWLITFIFLTVSFGMIGRSAAFPGEPRGFGGFTWGTAREDLGLMKYVGTDDAGNLLYEKPGDVPCFGRARLAAVEYGFKNGRLAVVTLKVDSLLQYLLLQDETVKRYGHGEEIAGQKESYTWSGANTRISLVGHFAES
jgi:hypothetical protein